MRLGLQPMGMDALATERHLAIAADLLPFEVFMKRLVLLFILLAAAAPALAQRYIWVNGERMGPASLAQIDAAHCRYVPNGRYWYNYQTGVWGYWGNPRPQGHVSDYCRAGGSARGGGGHALDRGPFGTYMSDGRCSFVNGVPVGRC
jgi:hypothetical protein